MPQYACQCFLQRQAARTASFASQEPEKHRVRETPLFVIFAKFGAVFIAPKWCHGNASKVALPTPTCLEKHRLQQLTTEVMSLSSREQALVLAPELPPP